MQNTLERPLAEVDFADGDATISLPRSHYYERLSVLVDYEVTVGSTGGTLNGNGILNLVDGLKVQLNGNQTIKNQSFAQSHLVDKYQYGHQPVADAVDLSTASTQTGQIQTFVDFTIAPGDPSAMIPSFETSDMTLEIEWGSGSDIADTVTIDSATAKVVSRERLRKAVANSSQREKKVLNNLMVFKEREKAKTLDVAGNIPVDLPIGNTYYAIPVQILDGGSPSDSLVAELKVEEDGVETHRSIPFDSAQARDRLEYGVDPTTGFAYVNFGLADDLDDVISTAGMDEFQLSLDTDGTSPTDPAEAVVTTQEIIR